MRNRFFWVFLLLIVFPALAGASTPETIEISVAKDDNLVNICKKYLEEPHKWRRVARVNRLKNPNLIYPGQKLVIPVELLRGVPMDGVVTFLKGHVSLYIRSFGKWKQLSIDDRISQGSRLRTGDESAIEITFEDGVSLFLRSNTSLEVASAQKKSTLHRLYRLFLDIGRSISNVKQITGQAPRFKIYTPSATAAARGTNFRVAVDSKADTRCEVLEGKIEVRGEKETVDVEEGEGTLIRKDEPPVKPKRLLPPPNIVHLKPLYRAMPIELAYDKVKGASSYRIMIAKDRMFKDVIKESKIRPGEKLKIFGIADGVYFVQNRSIDELDLEGLPSEPLELKVRVNPLPPFIQSPIDGAEYRERKAQFRWLKVRDAVNYHIQVSDNSEFSTITDEQKNFTALEYTTGVLDFKTYFFRVRSLAEDGYEGIWSDVISFRIVPPPPSPPVEKPKMDEKDIQIRWRDLGKGVSYHFQMSKKETFDELILDKVIDEPNITLQKPEEPGVYYLRTSAIDSEGYEGAFSVPQSFEIEKKFPYVPMGVLLTIILGILLL
ncbi:FecR domain-containing protein [Thermodesulfobacteriota bacterium]